MRVSLRLEALVLAAGSGSRFGGGKLLAPWGAGVLLDGALAAAFASPVRHVHVVWGADPEVAKGAADFARRAGEDYRLRLVHAPRHLEGLSASLAAGVAALPEDGDGVFVFLGDMPRAPADVAATMAEALGSGASAVATVFDGRRGHPVLFSRSLWPDLRKLTGDKGAGELLRALGDRLALIEAPHDGALFDVDRREDLA
jgi:molybdenum cofactor cytidylyltransferase